MKKQDIKKDPIRDRMLNAITAITDNPKISIQYTSLVAVLLLSIIFYNNSSTNKSNEYNLHSGVNQNKYIDGDKESALLNFNSILEEYSKSESYNQALIYSLNNAIESNDYDKVGSLIENSKFKTNDNTLQSLYYNLVANYYLSLNNVDDAIDYYNKAIKLSTTTDHSDQFKLNLLYLYLNNEKLNAYKELLMTVNIEDIKSFQLKSKFEQLPDIN